MSDIKLAYASSAAFTIGLATGPLATDANLLAGRQSTAVSNTSNKYLDYLIGGKITTGTSPTASKTIEVWAYGSVEDSPIYPDVITGSDGNVTFTSRDILANGLALIASIPTDNTSSRTYWIRPVSLLSLFGVVPKNFGLFVVHNTGVNLHSTSGNHALYYTGVYQTVA